jgi:uncharacterized membrane protein YgaE (UPF0421/DUF939 family)
VPAPRRRVGAGTGAVRVSANRPGTGRQLLARTRLRLDAALRRLRTSALPIVQCGVAAGAAWLVAHDLVGHERPFFAPIAAVISLGVSLANRTRRAVELVVGVSFGVLVADLLVSVIGSGWWQITLVVILAVAGAVFAGAGSLLINQAGASAVLVATLLPPGQAGGLDRCVDALIGGGVGLVVAAVLPTDPVGPVRRTSRALLDELAAVLRGVADALRDRDAGVALAALQRARRTQPLIDSLRGALHGGREVTAVSPMHRRRRRVLARYAELADRADYAMRNARVVARRAYSALLDGEPGVPDLPDVLAELAGAVDLLTAELTREGDLARARSAVVDVVVHAKVMSDDAVVLLGTSEQVLVAQLRSIALDLLQATGLSRTEALAAMHAS